MIAKNTTEPTTMFMKPFPGADPAAQSRRSLDRDPPSRPEPPLQPQPQQPGKPFGARSDEGLGAM